jgi:hypothetical protein
MQNKLEPMDIDDILEENIEENKEENIEENKEENKEQDDIQKKINKLLILEKFLLSKKSIKYNITNDTYILKEILPLLICIDNLHDFYKRINNGLIFQKIQNYILKKNLIEDEIKHIFERSLNVNSKKKRSDVLKYIISKLNKDVKEIKQILYECQKKTDKPIKLIKINRDIKKSADEIYVDTYNTFSRVFNANCPYKYAIDQAPICTKNNKNKLDWTYFYNNTKEEEDYLIQIDNPYIENNKQIKIKMIDGEIYMYVHDVHKDKYKKYLDEIGKLDELKKDNEEKKINLCIIENEEIYFIGILNNSINNIAKRFVQTMTIEELGAGLIFKFLGDYLQSVISLKSDKMYIYETIDQYSAIITIFNYYYMNIQKRFYLFIGNNILVTLKNDSITFNYLQSNYITEVLTDIIQDLKLNLKLNSISGGVKNKRPSSNITQTPEKSISENYSEQFITPQQEDLKKIRQSAKRRKSKEDIDKEGRIVATLNFDDIHVKKEYNFQEKIEEFIINYSNLYPEIFYLPIEKFKEKLIEIHNFLIEIYKNYNTLKTPNSATIIKKLECYTYLHITDILFNYNNMHKKDIIYEIFTDYGYYKKKELNEIINLISNNISELEIDDEKYIKDIEDNIFVDISDDYKEYEITELERFIDEEIKEQEDVIMSDVTGGYYKKYLKYKNKYIDFKKKKNYLSLSKMSFISK